MRTLRRPCAQCPHVCAILGESEDTLTLAVFFCGVGLLDFLASPGPGVATDRREISCSSIFRKFRPNPSPGRPIRGKNKNSQGQGMFPFPDQWGVDFLGIYVVYGDYQPLYCDLRSQLTWMGHGFPRNLRGLRRLSIPLQTLYKPCINQINHV